MSCRLVLKAVLTAALAASAAGACAQEPRQATVVNVEYRVQLGDTLFALLRDGADWQPVARTNNIADPKRLLPGSLIRIPAHLLREQPAVAEVVHAYGSVTVTRASTENEIALASGDNLAAGDVVTAREMADECARRAASVGVLEVRLLAAHASAAVGAATDDTAAARRHLRRGLDDLDRHRATFGGRDARAAVAGHAEDPDAVLRIGVELSSGG